MTPWVSCCTTSCLQMLLQVCRRLVHCEALHDQLQAVQLRTTCQANPEPLPAGNMAAGLRSMADAGSRRCIGRSPRTGGNSAPECLSELICVCSSPDLSTPTSLQLSPSPENLKRCYMSLSSLLLKACDFCRRTRRQLQPIKQAAGTDTGTKRSAKRGAANGGPQSSLSTRVSFDACCNKRVRAAGFARLCTIVRHRCRPSRPRPLLPGHGFSRRAARGSRLAWQLRQK